MKTKYGLYLLFVLLLAVSIIVVHNKRSGRFKGDENQFAVKDTGRISLIEIRSPENTVTLERMQGNWMINGLYYAGDKKIAGLLTIISRLQVSAPVPGSIRYEIITKLENDGKRLMVVTDRENPHVILMYHDTIHTDVTYMMLENSDQPLRIGIPGFPERNLARLFVDEVNYWRDNSIFKLREEEIFSVRMYDGLQPEKSFLLVNDKDSGYNLYTYSDSMEIPGIVTEQIRQYLSYFSSVSFERYLSDDEKMTQDDLNKNEPENIIILTDSQNHVIKVETFPWYVHRQDGPPQPDLDRLVAIINETDTVLVKYVELDPVIKEIDYFLEQEKNR
jgi:hypothetical protein